MSFYALLQRVQTVRGDCNPETQQLLDDLITFSAPKSHPRGVTCMTCHFTHAPACSICPRCHTKCPARKKADKKRAPPMQACYGCGKKNHIRRRVCQHCNIQLVWTCKGCKKTTSTKMDTCRHCKQVRTTPIPPAMACRGCHKKGDPLTCGCIFCKACIALVDALPMTQGRN